MAYQYTGGPFQVGTHQKVAYTGTAGTSTAIGTGVRTIRVCCSSAAYIAMSTAGTAATVAGIFMPAGVVEYFIVPAGTRVSAIQDTAGGNLHLTELSR